MSFDSVRNEYKDCRLRLLSEMSQPVLKKMATSPSYGIEMGVELHFSLCWRQGKHLSRRQLGFLGL